MINKMNDLALSVRSLGKAFSRGNSLGLSLLRKSQSEEDLFWALKDVSFDVPKGIGLGIIGGNGAGKSTLLKILSRILLPTCGEVEVHGKINSLLEVGTGFQPELSGRENIYLNGSILGMNRKEIDSVYEEIVDFSGVGDFIDMPVKHYSSGMYSRLAFSVAANVTGDILLIDEVLSVGDAEFRKKCLGRMNGLLSSEHRTVVFVSHSMESVMRFCSKALWLDRGQIKAFGDSEDVVTEYLRQVNRLSTKFVSSSNLKEPEKATTGESNAAYDGNDVLPNVVSTEIAAGFSAAAKINSVTLSSGTAGENCEVIKREDEISVVVECEITSAAYSIHPVLHLHCMPRAGVLEETHVFTCVADPMPRVAGRYCQIARIPGELLAVGQYSISVALVTRAKPLIRHCKLERVVSFQVVAPNDLGRTFLFEQLHGVIQPRLGWELHDMRSERGGDVLAGR